MESQPQNPEFRNNPENFQPCNSTDQTVQMPRLVCIFVVCMQQSGLLTMRDTIISKLNITLGIISQHFGNITQSPELGIFCVVFYKIGKKLTQYNIIIIII